MTTSREYVKPSFLEQMGLKPDPNAVEHTTTNHGVRLTKVYTRGGNPVDNSQPGFPVYHRRIANPWPLAAIGIGASLLIFGLILVGARGLTQFNIFYNIGLPLGGIGVMTASMFGFAEGNTFVAISAGNLGGLIGSVSLTFLPWTGIEAAYIGAAPSLAEGALDLYKALGIVFLCAMIPVFGVWLASFKTAFPVSGGALIITLALIIQGAAYLHYPMEASSKAAGALFIIVGIVLWYTAMATMLIEEGVKIPVFPLPRHDV